jgi:hypothetical protein
MGNSGTELRPWVRVAGSVGIVALLVLVLSFVGGFYKSGRPPVKTPSQDQAAAGANTVLTRFGFHHHKTEQPKSTTTVPSQFAPVTELPTTPSAAGGQNPSGGSASAGGSGSGSGGGGGGASTPSGGGGGSGGSGGSSGSGGSGGGGGTPAQPSGGSPTTNAPPVTIPSTATGSSPTTSPASSDTAPPDTSGTTLPSSSPPATQPNDPPPSGGGGAGPAPPPPSIVVPQTTTTTSTTSTTEPPIVFRGPPQTFVGPPQTIVGQDGPEVRVAATGPGQPAPAPSPPAKEADSVLDRVPALHEGHQVTVTALLMYDTVAQKYVVATHFFSPKGGERVGEISGLPAVPGIQVTMSAQGLAVSPADEETVNDDQIHATYTEWDWNATPDRSGSAVVTFSACAPGQTACLSNTLSVPISDKTYVGDVKGLVKGHLIQLFPSVSLFEVGRFAVKLKRKRTTKV